MRQFAERATSAQKSEIFAQSNDFELLIWQGEKNETFQYQVAFRALGTGRGCIAAG